MCFFGRIFRLLSGCAIVAGCLLLCSAPCRAGEPEIGCIPEEKQVYELFWEMVPVGMATLRSEALTEMERSGSHPSGDFRSALGFLFFSLP